MTNRESKAQPGPGVYSGNADAVMKVNPKWTIKGKGAGEKYSKDGPGPGQYEDRYQKHHTPHYTFGNRISKSFFKDGPGPGMYQSASTLSKQGGYVGVRSKLHKKNDQPGPGAYTMGTTFSKRGAPIGKGQRNEFGKGSANPGPGTYEANANMSRTHGAGFGKEKRSTIDNLKNNPGPGQYTIKEALFRDSKYASIKGRPKTAKNDSRPGPGHYQSKSLSSSPAYSMGLKTKLKGLTSKDNPGPGGYDPEYKGVKQSAPQVSFGKYTRSNLTGDKMLPGPGAYESKSTVGEGPSYGISMRYEKHKGDMRPGPGNYNPKDEFVRKSAPRAVISSGKRNGLLVGSGAPGPGNYDLNKSVDSGKHFSFGNEKRNGLLSRSSRGIPGPGTYASQSFVGKDTQGRTMFGKAKTKIGNENPGPGTYSASNRRNGPAYSVAGNRTIDPVMREKARVPAPGNYNPNDSFTKHSSPNVKFGKRPKTSSVRGDGAPGPGSYQLKSTLDSRGVAIAHKNPEKIHEKSPGPAAYNPKADLKYNSGPAFTISKMTGDE